LSKTINTWDEKKRLVSYIALNDDGDIISVELYFYNPISIIDFGIEKILTGKCGGCGERNKKEG
jgi:hypothetical protein